MSAPNYHQLEQKILQWGADKGILRYGTALGQATKTKEEAQELYDAILTHNNSEAFDAMGDTLVTLIMCSAILGVNLTYCLELAYDQIKDRTGHMNSDGIFVKDK